MVTALAYSLTNTFYDLFRHLYKIYYEITTIALIPMETTLMTLSTCKYDTLPSSYWD